MLMIADRFARYEEANDRFKLALIANNPRITPKLYPEWATEDVAEESKEIEEALASPGPVEYALDPMDPREAERVLAELASQPQTVKV